MWAPESVGDLFDQTVGTLLNPSIHLKVHTLDIAPLRNRITTAEALRCGTCSQGISKFYLHTHTFIRSRNELYLPLLSQP